MKAKYAGFNLYGQCMPSKQPIVDGFEDVDFNDASDVLFTHTRTILRIGNGLYIGESHEEGITCLVKVSLAEGTEIVGLSANDEAVTVLNQEGNLLKVNLYNYEVNTVPNFLNVEDRDETDRLSKIACGSNLTVGVTAHGNVFNGPNRLDFVGQNIVDVCVGREHCLLLENSGDVYSFGRGSRGQLGHGSLNDEPEPKQIEALAGIFIKKIATGGWHSCAISKDGDLYVWGWNSNGQLGLGPSVPPVLASPQLVPTDRIPPFKTGELSEENPPNVIDVACGARHTAFLCDNNTLYGMGWNKYKQLGRSLQDESIMEFTELQKISSQGSCRLKCGPWSTIVLFV